MNDRVTQFSDDATDVRLSPAGRSLLYLGSREIIETAIPDLELANWHVHVAPHFDDIPGLLRKFKPAVGLIAFDEVRLQQQPEILKFLAQPQHLRWIALIPKTALETLANRQLIGSAFYDYHTIPVDAERLLVVLGHAAGMTEMAREAIFASDPTVRRGADAHMVGSSPQMQEVFRELARFAGTDAPVLITGETGTGKEMAARAIHDHSTRKAGPFITLNCGALPATLLASELFGHEKGAFPGALSRKIGHIEQAHGGILFLDEIDSIPTEIQQQLVQFVQQKTFRRLGGGQDIEVDVRVITATYHRIDEMVWRGNFDEALMQRLSTLRIHIPPVRERDGDIPVLTQYFFHRFADELGHRVKGFTEESLQVMQDYRWPGNIRELSIRIRRAMVMCDKILITPEDLGLERQNAAPPRSTLSEARDYAEREAIHAALARSLGSVTKAAAQLKISRVSLYRLMEKHGITPPGQKSG